MPPISKSDTVDILLTPQFYTLKREKLPVRHAYQAKRIAPSLFEGLVEDPRSLEYFVYKEKDSWVFIAYDVSEIIDFLTKKSLSTQQVGKLFFAQQIIDQIDHPVAIDETLALTVLNETAVLVPRTALPQSTVFKNIQKVKTPKKGLRLEYGTESFIGRKQAFIIAGVIVFVSMLLIAEGWRYHKEKSIVEEKQAALYADYPALQNAYTRENIAQKYRMIDQEERAKRNIVSKVASLLVKGVILQDFKLEKKGFVAHFEIKNKSDQKRFQKLVKKSGFKVKRLSDSEFEVEGGR